MTDSMMAGAPSPGAALRVGRELQGWSQAQVAEQLKLSVHQIQALESDDFAALPGNTFVRGFVRNYARLLNLDAQALLDQLAALLPPERSQAALPKLPQDEGPSFASGGEAPRSFLKVFGAMAGLLIGAGIVFWYVQQPGAPEVALPEASAIEAVVLAASEPQASEPALAAASVASNASLVSRASQASVASEAVIVIPPASAPGAVLASVAIGNSDLRISTTSESWVQVLDGDGSKLYSGLLKPGSEQVLGGKLPYQLKVGNAPHTKVVFRGKPVDLASSTRAEVATLELK
ncbi:RodZ domain-containing protein [Chitinilyticum litopenaei]|uniref:RodZ domain-containing protein n=1 Tax=Chitinilyticum litopenaei TaxID=1121276 RepID=UPI0009DBD4DF|nr:RodZ domain-containing protein [Chitinilyticum litopenaei]